MNYLPFLTPIICCKKCEHYGNPEHPSRSDYCHIHVCAAWDEDGEPRTSHYPEVSEAWEQFGEDHAAKYCGEFELKFHTKIESNSL